MQRTQAGLLNLVDHPLAQIAATVNRPGASLGAWQKQIAHQCRYQHRAGHQHRTGRKSQQEELDQAQHKGSARIDNALLQQRPDRNFFNIQNVDQHEGREHRHEEKRGNQKTTRQISQHFGRLAQTAHQVARLQTGRIEATDFSRRRPRPHTARRQHRAIGQCGLAFQMRPVLQSRIAFNHHIRANADFIAYVDTAQHQLSTFNAGIFQADRITNACAITDAQQVRGTHRHRAQIALMPHLRAQHAQPHRVQ